MDNKKFNFLSLIMFVILALCITLTTSIFLVKYYSRLFFAAFVVNIVADIVIAVCFLFEIKKK